MSAVKVTMASGAMYVSNDQLEHIKGLLLGNGRRLQTISCVDGRTIHVSADQIESVEQIPDSDHLQATLAESARTELSPADEKLAFTGRALLTTAS